MQRVSPSGAICTPLPLLSSLFSSLLVESEHTPTWHHKSDKETIYGNWNRSYSFTNVKNLIAPSPLAFPVAQDANGLQCILTLSLSFSNSSTPSSNPLVARPVWYAASPTPTTYRVARTRMRPDLTVDCRSSAHSRSSVRVPSESHPLASPPVPPLLLLAHWPQPQSPSSFCSRPRSRCTSPSSNPCLRTPVSLYLHRLSDPSLWWSCQSSLPLSPSPPCLLRTHRLLVPSRLSHDNLTKYSQAAPHPLLVATGFFPTDNITNTITDGTLLGSTLRNSKTSE